MTDHRDRDDATEPDPDADRWSAWLPPLDPSSDRTGAAGPTQQGPPLPQSPGPALPQSPGPPPVPPPQAAQRASQSYRSAPPPHVGQKVAVGPKRYLALSVFATFFGFTPVGIIAIVISLSVGRHVRAGRLAEAERASRWARSWAIAALVLKLLWTLYFSFVLGS
ncbi:CD225/dispanin family protein [Humibacillus xanthopallidus]|uniref:Interferon-induced transmembrane protein n=1 Tax=Humibacillus xanthopallidus TaxID=412689 RepID=A0A543I342_9MICO|nr:CD225/dispanin family protein [Humibacillus xanthopallidus]TQM65016.1 interferon-induced transmembrane protein [Humibacillus xanthopallidus]